MVSSSPSRAFELDDVVSILRRRWIFFLLPVIVITWVAFFLSSAQPDRFEASARVLLGDTAAEEVIGSSSQNIRYRDRLLENELRTATGDAARAEVADRFGVPVADIPKVTTTAENGADVLVFTAGDASPENAATIANVWAESYLTLKQETAETSITNAVSQLEQKLVELEAERETVRSELVRLEDALARADDATRPRAQLSVDREASRISSSVTLIDAKINATAASITDLRLGADLASGTGPRLVTRATPPANSSNVPTAVVVFLGLVIGAIAGTAIGLARERFDRAVRTPDDLEALGLLHLGSIPKTARTDSSESALASLERRESPQAAAYQKVRTALEFLSAERRMTTLAITSASPGEGKTTVAANLATALAQSGRRTILIDADLRRPRVHKVFQIKQSPGLTNVVLDPPTLPASVWPIAPLAGSLVVLPAGPLPHHPVGLLSSPDFAVAARALSRVADLAVFDGPPVLPVADALELAGHVSGTVLVVDAGRTTRDDLERALAGLTRAGAVVVGAILVGVKQSARSYTYRDGADDDVERLTPEEAERTSAFGDDPAAEVQDSVSISA